MFKYKYVYCSLLISVVLTFIISVRTRKEETAHSFPSELKLLFFSALMDKLQRNSHFLRVQRYTYYFIQAILLTYYITLFNLFKDYYRAIILVLVHNSYAFAVQ